MLPDLLNFIDENGLKIFLEMKGWLPTNPIVFDGIAVVKPDFYPDRHVLARSKRGYIYAYGDTRIQYAGQEFSSTEELLDKCGTEALNDFGNWVFIEEKEWVITRDGLDWLYSFSTLDKLPKRTKYRC
jgi:hypothetical protein